MVSSLAEGGSGTQVAGGWPGRRGRRSYRPGFLAQSLARLPGKQFCLRVVPVTARPDPAPSIPPPPPPTLAQTPEGAGAARSRGLALGSTEPALRVAGSLDSQPVLWNTWDLGIFSKRREPAAGRIRQESADSVSHFENVLILA